MIKKSFLVTSPYGVVTSDGVSHPTGSMIYEISSVVSQLLEKGWIVKSNKRGLTKSDDRTFVWRGNWQYGVVYALNDGVTFNGCNYVAIVENVNKMPPSDQWQRLKI